MQVFCDCKIKLTIKGIAIKNLDKTHTHTERDALTVSNKIVYVLTLCTVIAKDKKDFQDEEKPPKKKKQEPTKAVTHKHAAITDYFKGNQKNGEAGLSNKTDDEKGEHFKFYLSYTSI